MRRLPTSSRLPALLIVVFPALGLPCAAVAQAPSSLPIDATEQDAGTPDAPKDRADIGADGARPVASIDTGPLISPPAVAADADNPAFLHATVNTVDVGDVFVVLREKDVLAKVADLEKSGMHAEGGTREKWGEDTLVSLESLAPKLTFFLDERSLSLAITADAKAFEGTVLDLRTKRPEGIVYDASPSLFVNYALTGSNLQRANEARASGVAEAGLSVSRHLLYASGQRSTVNGSWDRLMTNLTFDLRERLTTIVLGDTNAISGDPLGGGMAMGGLSVARNFGLDPYYVFLPTQRVSGTVLTPSTVDVFVNGQLVRRETLPPGQFNLQNLPVTSGSGETRVVVRDAFGATQTLVSPYYMALGTLAKGLQDFSYSIGFARENYGSESWGYGRLGFLFRHRLGLTDWLTLGARVEGTLDMVSGGPNLAMRLPIGELGASAAVSRQDRFTGGAAMLSYSYMGRPLYFQAGVRYQTLDYATLMVTPSNLPPPNALPVGVPSSPDRERLEVMASVARNVGKVASVSLQYQGAEWYAQSWSNRVALMANRTVTPWMYAFATIATTFSSQLPAGYEMFLGVSFTPADRVTAGATRNDRWGGQGGGHSGASQAIVQRSLPLGPGLGYRLVASQGDNQVNQANVQYQGAYGRVEADYQREGYDTSTAGHATLTGTGSLVLIGRRAFLTRFMQGSYALIRVPDVGGVHSLMSNQVVGSTDSHGDLLIPNLLPYYGNRIGIDDKDIPLDHDIAATERTIAPPYRGGMIVTFPVRQVLSVSGAVEIEDNGTTILPAYGQIIVHVAEQKVVSPLDETGNFYLENVPPGTYPAEVQYAAGTCSFPLAAAAGTSALVNVGTVKCIVADKEAE